MKMLCTLPVCRALARRCRILLATALMAGCVQTGAAQAPDGHAPAVPHQSPLIGSAAKEDLARCRVHQVTNLPGSDEFASHFLETMVTDPADPKTVWGLSADLSNRIPPQDRAMYLLQSSDDGATWTLAARLDSRYFHAEIAEGLRNGLAVSPGGTDFVITTQQGAFQVTPQSNTSEPVVNPIAGPRVPDPLPALSIPKHAGDPVRAGVVAMTPDGKRAVVGYGYFDLNPQIFTYRRRARGGAWVEDGRIAPLPTDLDIFSMQFANAQDVRPRYLYVGTGDQAYRIDLRTRQWTRIRGVGPDSAIHGMSTLGGLHLAACWGVYNPVDAVSVSRVTHASFLLHRTKDEVGPNIRAYGIEVDPARHNREVLTAITGVYLSRDSGKSWKRLNDLPEGEFHAAHFNADGSVIVSGFPGTFLANPFSAACSPHLTRRTE
jgi:hypothetical protein